MKTPILNDVKKHFKDALKIKGIYSENEYKIDTECLGIYFDHGTYRENTNNSNQQLLLWDKENGYAEILTHKEKNLTMKITSTQVRQLVNNIENGKPELAEQDLKQWFPKCFEPKPELLKWYKTPNNGFYMIKSRKNNKLDCCGFSPDSKTWLEMEVHISEIDEDVLATHEEIEPVLISEAKNRGFEKGVLFNAAPFSNDKNRELGCEFYEFDGFSKNGLQCQTPTHTWDKHNSNPFIFNKGVWAEIIETITKAEAEKTLGKKIV